MTAPELLSSNPRYSPPLLNLEIVCSDDDPLRSFPDENYIIVRPQDRRGEYPLGGIRHIIRQSQAAQCHGLGGMRVPQFDPIGKLVVFVQ